MSDKPVIAVDFDDTLAHCDTWQGPQTLSQPIPGAVEFLRALANKYSPVVFSARAATMTGQAAIWAWAREHGVEDLLYGVTSNKDFAFKHIVDDRAVAFRGDYDEVLRQLGINQLRLVTL